MERFFEENSTDKAVIYRMNRNVAHYHLPGLFGLLNCIVCSCHCIVSTGNTSMTGAI